MDANADHLSLLLQVNAVLNSSRSRESVMRDLLCQVNTALGGQRGFVVLRKDGQWESLAAHYVDPTLESSERLYSRNVVNQVGSSGEPMLSTDALQDPRLGAFGSVTVQALRSIMCAPLRWAGEVRGVVYVDHNVHVGIFQGRHLDLLSAMARAGNGSFYHVRTPQDIVSTFQVELQGMVSTYGQAVSLGVEPRNGVELLRVVNPLDTTPGGRYQVADLVHGCPIDVVIELLVPALKGQLDLCEFRLAWTELETGERHHSRHSLRLPVVPRGQLSEFPLDLEVARKGALQASARCMREVIELLDRQDRDHAGKALRFGLQILSEAGPHPELEDAARQFQRLLADLERGAVASMRKEARSYSGSLSLGSVVFNTGFREFMALPAHERTPEKLNELMGFKPSA